jgi:hypothetical protein
MASAFESADRPSEAVYRAGAPALVTNWRAASSRELHFARLRADATTSCIHHTNGRMSKRPAGTIGVRARRLIVYIVHIVHNPSPTLANKRSDVCRRGLASRQQCLAASRRDCILPTASPPTVAHFFFSNPLLLIQLSALDTAIPRPRHPSFAL